MFNHLIDSKPLSEMQLLDCIPKHKGIESTNDYFSIPTT